MGMLPQLIAVIPTVETLHSTTQVLWALWVCNQSGIQARGAGISRRTLPYVVKVSGLQ